MSIDPDPIEEFVHQGQLRLSAHRPRIPGGPRSTVEVLQRVLAEDADREAVVGRSGRLTYAELDARANQAAQLLLAAGVRRGDRVACSLPNDIDVVVFFHAAMRAGAIWVGVNQKLAPPEKQYILDDAGVRLLLGDRAAAEVVERCRNELPELRSVVVCEPGDADDWRASLDTFDGARRPAVDVDPWGPAAIAYTSGTTGFPKGVVHSHHNLLLPGAVGIAARGCGPDMRKGDCFPLTILNLQVLSTLLVPQAGGTSVIIDRVDPAGIAQWLRDERCTVFNGAPAMLYGLAVADEVGADDLATLRDVISGGADTPESIVERFRVRFGITLSNTYGLTEAPTWITFEPPGEHSPGSSGTVVGDFELVIVDADDRAVAPGVTGEICVRATTTGRWADVYTPMLGYLNRPDATDETLRNGLLHTGDIGHLDEEGRLRVTDRKSLMILRGGANVYPAEVERVLHLDPAVEACAVFGVADDRLGQRVVAVVQLAPGASRSAEELRSFCAASLAKYKVPERITFVDQLPRNSMGKIVRTQLASLDSLSN